MTFKEKGYGGAAREQECGNRLGRRFVLLSEGSGEGVLG